jgi:tetratricopeptide (TPR) repeat protein
MPDDDPIVKAGSRVETLVEAAFAAARDEAASPLERAEMLMELAMGLQQRPKTADYLVAAIRLYDEALAVCPKDEQLFAARITARKATALQAVPESGTGLLEEARKAYEKAIPVVRSLGTGEELAEAEMNYGVVLQYLAGAGRARITDAIAAYQRAVRTFDAKRFPIEFALLQNNLSTAYLSMPFTDERAKFREALAVQCFEEALEVVNLIEHPTEYAMLQNNLGNALQNASSGHPLENRLQALAAYDEALRVRTRASAPREYANTLSNKGNCLWGLPDDPEHPERGGQANLRAAKACYEEAHSIFVAEGELEQARIVAEALSELEAQM